MKNESDRLSPGDLAPPFTLESSDGATVSLDMYEGRYVALYFFRGTW